MNRFLFVPDYIWYFFVKSEMCCEQNTAGSLEKDVSR
jgi:hypothetical protein